MSDLVFDRYETALKTLETKDESLPREVIEGDQEINELYLEL
jgi:phosphate transport system protein